MKSGVVSSSTRYEDDPAAQIFVSAFPEGAVWEAVGEALGVSRQRVIQIETQALRRLREMVVVRTEFKAVLEHILNRRE
jgi:DNA-directed RNA polymerase sigma subunit (sigma70/sigma32)